MRSNLPVTNIEHILKNADTLVSTTDLKSRITYVNPSFIRISGFTEKELVNAPHSIVRHPDMPPEAFADLWQTIQSGKSWTALVKNRRKNGDYYWVKANVTPLIENNQTMGYMSVRVKPSREEIAAASTLYQQMREGRSRYRVCNGLVTRTDWLGRLLFWSHVSISTRIWITMLVMTLMVIGIETVGLLWLETGLQKASFDWSQFLVLAGTSLGVGSVLAAWLSSSITQPLGNILDFARRIASGDLGNRINTLRNDEIGQIIRGLNQTNVNLMGVVSDVHIQVDDMYVEIDEIANSINDLSVRTESQASSLEETAASMEQIHATVQQTADLARQANQLSQSASTIAVQSGAVVGQTVTNMADIHASSTKIADIISVIDAIAFQTNILALNAAVEAARAGEQGRGFAVVAGEVRNLAQKTTMAAKEIKSLIYDSLTKVQTGAKLSQDASKAMEEVVAAIGRVSTIMSEITHAATEQAIGISQVNEAAMQLDRVTQENAAFVERITVAAELLTTQANMLLGAINVFKVDSVRQ
ncbi:MAG: PAS domain-containing protein [Candidatus Contendobacter sp.]|nr:PAS domain-containing protein [Candidatus Contendobacter sp.]